jgi:hypothetical protein
MSLAIHISVVVKQISLLKLIYDRQSVLVSGTHLGPATNFSFSLKFPFGSCGFVILYRPLWQEDRSVIYCTTASGPCQSSHSLVEVPQNSRPYFTLSSETSPTWRVRSLYLYPLGTGWPSPWGLGSLFVASYDSQDYGGGILTCLHTPLLWKHKLQKQLNIFLYNLHYN